jgi:hypothetical protein
MRFLKKLGDILRWLGDILSGDCWRGLAVLTTAAGIVVGSILTCGVFRLSESNLDLARSRETADVRVEASIYIPTIDAAPQFEGKWLLRLNIVNYGPAPAAPLHLVGAIGINTRSRGFPFLVIEEDTARVFDSSLREVTNPLEVDVAVLPVSTFFVDVTLLPQGETLDVVMEVSPAADLIDYARALYSKESWGWWPAPDLPYVPPGSVSKLELSECVLDWMTASGKNVNGSFFPEDRSERGVEDPDCPCANVLQ